MSIAVRLVALLCLLAACAQARATPAVTLGSKNFTEGVLLDPVYSGKGMAGLIDLCRKANATQRPSRPSTPIWCAVIRRISPRTECPNRFNAGQD